MNEFRYLGCDKGRFELVHSDVGGNVFTKCDVVLCSAKNT